MPRRSRRRHDVERYAQAVLTALQHLGDKAPRMTVIEHAADFLELEFADLEHKRKSDSARVLLVQRKLIYPPDPDALGTWELTPSGWNM